MGVGVGVRGGGGGGTVKRGQEKIKKIKTTINFMVLILEANELQSKLL